MLKVRVETKVLVFFTSTPKWLKRGGKGDTFFHPFQGYGKELGMG